VGEQPTFVHSEASITADTRDFPGHTIRGALYRAAAARYSDRDTGLFSFRRYEAEAAQFVPLADSRVVLALHGWLVGSETDEGDVVPFYLLPSLGGSNSLRAYTDYRFHDRNMLLVNAEARVAMMTHVDAAVFFDAGNVGARMSDLNLDKRAYGFGLRMHSRRQTFARLDVAHGDEGWRFFFRLTDPLNLARLSRLTAAVPFIP
jgi:outer membrane protein assembly factor BamA